MRFPEFLGYTNLVMKSDQKAALKTLMAKVRSHRGDQTQTMHEMSPVGDSKANGFVERVSRTFKAKSELSDLTLNPVLE